MSDKPQFVDTNILVYAHDRSAGAKHERARALIAELWKTGDGCLSIQVLQEFYVNITRTVAKPMDSHTARQIIADLGQWTIHAPRIDDVLDAIALQQGRRLSFWDAMIIASAIRLGCLTLWSEDLNDGQAYEGVRIINPFTRA